MLRVIYLELSVNNYFSLIIEVLVMKRGDPFGGPRDEELRDDAEMTTLTFNDTMTSVTASQSFD